MKEIVRRMGVTMRQADARGKKRAKEKPQDEPDIDELLGSLE